MENICFDANFPGGSDGKESACNAGDPGSIPGLERSPGEGNGNPLQYSCLENPMEGGRLQTMQSQRVGHDWATELNWPESPFYGKPRKHIKKQRYHFADKVLHSQSYGFSSSHVWMWDLDHKESWVPKNWCFWTLVLEKTLESLLDCKEIQPVNPKENQSWIFTGRIVAWSPNTLATSCEEPTHWKKPSCWDRLKAIRGWDG